MFLNYFSQCIEQATGTKSVRTIETYHYARNRLEDYLHKGDIPIENVTEEFVGRYVRHLKDCGLTLNTISFHMRILRHIYNQAVKHGLTYDRKPFKQAYTKTVKTVKRAVTIDTIKAVKHYDTDNRNVCFARDMFLFSFYTHGMSFVDMSYLTEKNIQDGILTYQRHKTGQIIRLKWEPSMQEIVDKYHVNGQPYLLPIIHTQNGKERNQYRGKQYHINLGLRDISQAINAERMLTMYVARHSWASIAETFGLPVNLISVGLGHTSVKTTQVYLKLLRMNMIDQTNAKIISQVGKEGNV